MSIAATNVVVVNATSTRCSGEKRLPITNHEMLRMRSTESWPRKELCSMKCSEHNCYARFSMNHHRPSMIQQMISWTCWLIRTAVIHGRFWKIVQCQCPSNGFNHMWFQKKHAVCKETGDFSRLKECCSRTISGYIITWCVYVIYINTTCDIQCLQQFWIPILLVIR